MIVTAKDIDGVLVFEHKGVNSFEYDFANDIFVVNDVVLHRENVGSLNVEEDFKVVN